jgi:hypothetical protein
MRNLLKFRSSACLCFVRLTLNLGFNIAHHIYGVSHAHGARSILYNIHVHPNVQSRQSAENRTQGRRSSSKASYHSTLFVKPATPAVPDEYLTLLINERKESYQRLLNRQATICYLVCFLEVDFDHFGTLSDTQY